jgi:tRNA/rRNA methyltransferase
MSAPWSFSAEGKPVVAQSETPVVILVHPQLGENIGACARAMANFSLSELRLVKPRDGWPSGRAIAAASGAVSIVENAKLYETLEEAIADVHVVLATTARRRGMIKPVLTPETAAKECRAKIAEGKRVALLFGPERTGLESDHISLADAVVMAPVNPAFASINLAQAVLLVGYEWYKQLPEAQGLGRSTQKEPAGQEGLQLIDTRPATKQELTIFFDRLERELDKTSYFYPPEKAPSMRRNLRNIFSRMELTERELRMLHGIISAFTVHRFMPKEE